MTVVFIGGTNGLLSQETVRIILALVLSDQDDIGCGAQSAKATDKNCSGGSGWKGFFYDDLPESTQGPGRSCRKHNCPPSGKTRELPDQGRAIYRHIADQSTPDRVAGHHQEFV